MDLEISFSEVFDVDQGVFLLVSLMFCAENNMNTFEHKNIEDLGGGCVNIESLW